MSVRDCLQAYRELSKEVFDINAFNVAFNLLRGSRFSGYRLQKAVEELVEQYKGGTSTEMWDNPENRSRRERIWEAARATFCTPSFFPDVQVDGIYYSDGGMGYNNPTNLVLQEAQSLWGPDQEIGCLLSLGTGSVDSFMRLINSSFDPFDFVGIFKRMAVSCDGVHQEMKSNQLVTPFYYRFNPTMTENISLDEWRKLEDLEEIAKNYLYGSRRKVAAFARAMVN
ncbi:hypothetical protein FRC00_013162 [Tulasnella sp. 408]|nr:hypothetical protein FRC00_013162 [Tulasnella sp. 408]